MPSADKLLSPLAEAELDAVDPAHDIEAWTKSLFGESLQRASGSLPVSAMWRGGSDSLNLAKPQSGWNERSILPGDLSGFKVHRSAKEPNLFALAPGSSPTQRAAGRTTESLFAAEFATHALLRILEASSASREPRLGVREHFPERSNDARLASLEANIRELAQRVDELEVELGRGSESIEEPFDTWLRQNVERVRSLGSAYFAVSLSTNAIVATDADEDAFQAKLEALPPEIRRELFISHSSELLSQ